MTSKKASNADNQQERLEICGWITGFVDGEGSFLINIFKSPRAKMGWQVFPEFNVSQSKKDIALLYEVQRFFNCGHIYIHRMRAKKEKRWDILYKYCVRSRKDLQEKIIPFFKEHPCRSSVKRNDFYRFIEVIDLIEKKEHLLVKGMKKIARIIKSMNHRKPFNLLSASKFLTSSETIRRAERSKR